MLSFPQIMRERAQHQPEKIACRFLEGASLQASTLSFRELWGCARAVAYQLRQHGLAGQRVLLICKSQRTFVIAFFACLLAGAVAVPIPPPRRNSLLDRLRWIARDARASALVFDCDEVGQARADLAGNAIASIDLRAVATGEALVVPSSYQPSLPDDDAPAFLQYTSGSTGDPRGVIVSHRNLVENAALTRDAMAISEESVVFTALPLFHDMGLVGGILQLMYSGCEAGFLSPSEFAQYPERWLQIVSKYRVTVSGGPNFMYELTARSVTPEQLQGVDLSTWRVAFCGAEPIRAATIARFTQRFASLGFRPDAFYPCYGMAEATLFVTGAQVGSAPALCRRDGAEIVGCGEPRGDMRVEIVDPSSRTRVAIGEVGEIWISGGSVAQGYWQQPELTQQTFHATIAGDDEVRYLRSGDLGFISDGQLYVTGRIKDVIIVNGRKFAPQDIEDEAEQSHAALRQAGGAAFEITEGGTSRLVIVFEVGREWLRRRDDFPAVTRAIRTAVSSVFGIAVADVVLIKPGALPRTSSGKVRRSQCRVDYVSNALERLAAVEPA